MDRPALAKAQLLGISRTDVEEAVLAGHERRSRNNGAADWLLRSRRLAIAYNHPGDDDLTASVVILRTARRVISTNTPPSVRNGSNTAARD